MPALGAGIHVFPASRAVSLKTWMAGTSPAMTTDSRALPPRERKHVAILLQDRLALILVDAVHRREFVLPAPRPHSIEDRARIGKRPVGSLLRRHARIERRRPAAVHDLDVGLGID